MPFLYKTVLVIGATSGIGLALAEKFISHGCHVIAVGRRQENLDSLSKKHGDAKVTTVKFDITDLEEIPEFAASVIKKHPKLDSVILNSGIQCGIDFTKPESIDLGLVGLEMTTNYTAQVHLLKAFLPHLQELSKSSPTSIIITTSGLALIPLPRCPNYSSSKAAMHHLILSLRYQLSSFFPFLKIIELLPLAV